MSLVMWRVGIRYKLYPEIRERDVHTPAHAPTRRHRDVHGRAARALLIASQIPFFRLVFFDGNERQIVAILLAATLIVLMGVLDDFFDLDWTTKLIGQVIAAGLLAWLGGLQIDYAADRRRHDPVHLVVAGADPDRGRRRDEHDELHRRARRPRRRHRDHRQRRLLPLQLHGAAGRAAQTSYFSLGTLHLGHHAAASASASCR